MRIVRTFGLALMTAALLPSLSSAQAATDARLGFEDSWFWGLKGGGTMFTTGEDNNTRVTAPTVGLEWLVTRSRIALNMSIEQAFFDDRSLVFDPSSLGSVRSVAISDLRRYHASLLFAPVQYGSVRPYAGIGLAINVIQNAQPEGSFTSDSAQTAVFSRVSELSSRASAVLTAGAQAQFQRVGLFLQVSTMPTRNNFLISGAANTFMLEGGVRYNLTTAIEQLRSRVPIPGR